MHVYKFTHTYTWCSYISLNELRSVNYTMFGSLHDVKLFSFGPLLLLLLLYFLLLNISNVHKITE